MGCLIHDHWKPYYRYQACLHTLCNAHHKRELTRAHEQDDQQWAKAMEDLLGEINIAVKDTGGFLPKSERKKWRRKYREVLKANKKTKGRLARRNSRNLLERLRDYEGDVLRFMEDLTISFTNNQAERDIRMTKVQQKISGCFRLFQVAEIFCAVRSYLSTCSKHGVNAKEALQHLFEGTWPEFIQKEMNAVEMC